MIRKTLTLMLLVGAAVLTACSEHLNEEADQYYDWQNRNNTAFDQKMQTAKAAIASAKAQYGINWEANCRYRLFRNYQLVDVSQANSHDSIVVEVIEAGTGDISPIYTDTVRYNYLGRLLPTDSYPEGKIFSHSGSTVYPADIFNPTSSSPYKAAISSQIQGVATALQNMHIGDHWIVTIPAELAYGTSGTSNIPGSSVLFFEMQLKAFYHPGQPVPEWR